MNASAPRGAGIEPAAVEAVVLADVLVAAKADGAEALAASASGDNAFDFAKPMRLVWG
jgi:hypothetical protein